MSSINLKSSIKKILLSNNINAPSDVINTIYDHITRTNNITESYVLEVYYKIYIEHILIQYNIDINNLVLTDTARYIINDSDRININDENVILNIYIDLTEHTKNKLKEAIRKEIEILKESTSSLSRLVINDELLDEITTRTMNSQNYARGNMKKIFFDYISSKTSDIKIPEETSKLKIQDIPTKSKSEKTSNTRTPYQPRIQDQPRIHDQPIHPSDQHIHPSDQPIHKTDQPIHPSDQSIKQTQLKNPSSSNPRIPAHTPAQYNIDDTIDIPELDFQLTRKSQFIDNTSPLKPNIRRYLINDWITIFSIISCGEDTEDRRRRHNYNPTAIPNYEIYSTVDQIKYYGAIKPDINITLFNDIPDFDLINVLGNGYCFYNCFYIFTTITYTKDRLKTIYDNLGLFRQDYLNPQQTLPRIQSKIQSVNNFIKGIKAHVHDYINNQVDYEDELKSEFHEVVNDTNIPDTELASINIINIINCRIVIIPTDVNYQSTFNPICFVPRETNRQTDYCTIIQRNNTHYYLLIPQHNTMDNRKTMFENYSKLCR